MRFFWALGLLITLCASANAATLHHSRPHHRVLILASVPDPSMRNFSQPTICLAKPPFFCEVNGE